MRAPGGILTLAYTLEGEMSRLRLPPPLPPCRADGLWRHTCLEAFVALQPGPSYLELNFSPSGEWAAYTFSGYRSGMAVALDVETPAIVASRGEAGLSVEVTVGLKCLRGGAAARIALAAVIEGTSGNLSYWALAHPPGKPDFHHPSSFSLMI